MSQFSPKSNMVLGVLSLLAFLVLLSVENSKIDEKQRWYAEKLTAACLAHHAAMFLKLDRLQNGVFVDAVNDPNQTGLIGQEHSLITTDYGKLDAKLAATDPNFAAVFVDLLKEAGVGENDPVAVAMTGSFPGLNIALYAALKTLKARPIVITSVGASSWGATDPYFTWLDMERRLAEADIFRIRSVAASIGSGADMGRGLSSGGRELILKAIARNKCTLIHETHMNHSIDKRMQLYRQYAADLPIKVFVNIGGGIASIGHRVNDDLVPPGLTHALPVWNYPRQGVLIRMARKNIPVIHMKNIRQIQKKYGLMESVVPLPEPGVGTLFVKRIYDLKLTFVSTLLLTAAVFWVYYIEKRRHRLGTEVISSKARPATLSPQNGTLAAANLSSSTVKSPAVHLTDFSQIEHRN